MDLKTNSNFNQSWEQSDTVQASVKNIYPDKIPSQEDFSVDQVISDTKGLKNQSNNNDDKEGSQPVQTFIEEAKSNGNINTYFVLPSCKFCTIIHGKTEKLIFEDELCAAFHDKKKKNAQMHILVCSKDHIKNSHEVPKERISLLKHLQDVGELLLKKLKPDCSYRFGYHEPPMNSVDHIHLHGLVLPIRPFYLDKVIYGTKLASTETIISKILNNEIGSGQT